MAKRPEILIVGAGIGGLTLALALHHRGIACRLVDAAPELQEIGAGINLLPHAVAVLAELGLEPHLAAAGVAVRELRFYTRHGQLIHAQPRGLAAGHATAQYSIHRASLQSILCDAALERIGAAALRLGARCSGIRQTGSSACADLIDSRTGQPLPSMNADAAIGCDGIHSVVRAQLLGGSDPPRYAGIAMWRGVARAPAFLGGRTMVLAGSLEAGKIVVYPIRSPGDGSHPLLNWVAERRDARMSPQDWHATGDPAELRWLERDWRIDGLDVPALVRRTETILRYPMVDKDPLPSWTRGRVTLLGDAAHPMYPFGSNGACQAILDAAALADSLATSEDVSHALRRYELSRRPATSEVVLLNRRGSPDSILDEVDRRSTGRPFGSIDDVMTPAERDDILRRYVQVTSGPPRAPAHAPRARAAQA
jgi:2-polyprenyl-6-methoxyphenol hydroxylase-like FAD-dependent oxidoreductase